MSQTPPSSDLTWMERALVLAREARGHVWPNPPVGCVIVKDSDVLAEAATHPGGRPHAERKAIDQAGEAASGATLYVTLEPCCHWGKTPPCTEAIIAAGIARVICAVQDPDPRVNGGGFAKLRDAGVEVAVGLCREDAQEVMSGFFHRIHTGAPKIVQTPVGLSAVPHGVDALLQTTQRGLTLRTRTGVQDCPYRATDAVMRWMGDLGLTTVAVTKDDPFLVGFLTSSDVAPCSDVRDAAFETGP
ncbi:MAG: bifunctional diaminohydroxyphosphoribosylaminopyrimidine deaminase/5-amino-6-(5-phosphoribosylamino)uracil reductase RibD [Pseudomonadota bacterium]